MDLGPLYSKGNGRLGHVLQKLVPQIVYDCGANDGDFIPRWLDAGAFKVYAFEPVPDMIARLRARFRDDPHVSIEPIGLSDQIMTVANMKPHNTWTLLPCSGRNDVSIDYVHKPPFAVSFTTLDKFCETHPAPDFIKMDVDGYEYRAMLGGGKMFISKQPPIYWECSYLPTLIGDSLERLCKLIYLWGYEAWNLDLTFCAPNALTLLANTPMHSSFDILLLPRGFVHKHQLV